MNPMQSAVFRLAMALLRWFCPEHLYEEIEGDLVQRFNSDVCRFGVNRSQWRLLWNVVRFCRPGIVLRNRFSGRPEHIILLGNYFTTSYRHLLKNKVNFLFKLAGLTLAFFSFLVIVLYVSYQLSFDTYHRNYESIYRVNSERRESGVQAKYAIAPLALGPMLQSVLPEVETYVRVRGVNQSHIRYNGHVFPFDMLLADSTLFDVFSFQFIAGDRRALTRPASIVLTQGLAAKIFGTTDPMHQFVTLTNSDKLYEVAAVIEDIPHQSHLHTEAFIPITDTDHQFSIASVLSPVEFVDWSAILYVRFRTGSTRAVLSQKLQSIMDRILSAKDRAESGFALSLQPLEDIYLDSPLKYEYTAKGSTLYLYIFIVLSVFLLLVASANYINLSVADFTGRLREIGIRKIMGARKGQVVFQVMLEGGLYCLCALLLSVAALYALFPQVHRFVDPHLEFGMLWHRDVVGVVLLMLLVLMLSATVFPAWRIARSTSAGDLRSAQGGAQNPAFATTLLAVQFVVSILCITATLVIGRQLHFIHNKELGFDRKNLLVLLTPENFSVQKMQALTHELGTIPGVEHVSNSSFKIGGGYWKDWYNVEINGAMKAMELYEVFSDDDIFQTLGLKLIAGRTFRADYPADSGAAFVINETAAREMGWTDPVGKRINTHPEENGRWEGTVVGVVGDIHISPLYDKVQPLVMRLPWQRDYPEYFVYVRIKGPQQEVVKAIESKYKAIMPGYPLDIDLVDEFFNSRYQKEERAFASLQFGSLVVVLIAGLGIFSLSMYMSVRRMKEFGIRKILGATVRQIAFLHANRFLKIVVVSNIITLPLSFWLMNAWLDRFAYHTVMDAGVFALVGALSVLLVVFSTGYASWRSGRSNPIEIIRTQS